MHNFKKIILHTALLIFFVIIILICSTLPYFWGESYYYQDYKVRTSLSGKLDTLVIGSSHALRSIKPTVLNEKLNTKAYNLSSPLMSMYGRYVMLEKEINRNPIKTVYLEISYNALTLDRKTLGLEGDLYVLGRFDNVFERINFFTNAFPPDEYRKVLSDIIVRSKNSFSIHNTIEQYKTFGYLSMPSNNQLLSDEVKEKVKNTKVLDTKIKEESLYYFDKIIKLCKKNNIRVIFVVTPVTERMILEYSNLDDIFSQYIDLAKKYNCEYYDFNLDKHRKKLYSEETSFYDITHMSDSGAEIFSNRLAEIIKCVDQGNNVSNYFLNSYAELKKLL